MAKQMERMGNVGLDDVLSQFDMGSEPTEEEVQAMQEEIDRMMGKDKTKLSVLRTKLKTIQEKVNNNPSNDELDELMDELNVIGRAIKTMEKAITNE